MRTNSGRDWQAGVMGDPASNGTGNYAPATWMALSTDTAAPVATDTTLPSELTGGTFARAQGAYGHTSGTSTYTLTKQFTSDRIATVAKLGVFTASTSGVLVFETLLDTATALKSGDVVQVVSTVTL